MVTLSYVLVPGELLIRSYTFNNTGYSLYAPSTEFRYVIIPRGTVGAA